MEEPKPWQVTSERYLSCKFSPDIKAPKPFQDLHLSRVFFSRHDKSSRSRWRTRFVWCHQMKRSRNLKEHVCVRWVWGFTLTHSETHIIYLRNYSPAHDKSALQRRACEANLSEADCVNATQNPFSTFSRQALFDGAKYNQITVCFNRSTWITAVKQTPPAAVWMQALITAVRWWV